mmetsp:Transcript_35695/g.79388  ORF Transcript_35695/g.79388 Transcript_35695/m.79388 type:complete len:458 (-) Transcript_35695:917-2290(-)
MSQLLCLWVVELEEHQDVMLGPGQQLLGGVVLPPQTLLAVGDGHLQEQLEVHDGVLSGRGTLLPVLPELQHNGVLLLGRERPGGAEGGVLTSGPRPPPLLLLRHTQPLSHQRLEVLELGVLAHPEDAVRTQPVVVDEVKVLLRAADLGVQVLVSGDLEGGIQVSLALLLLPLLLLTLLLLQPVPQVGCDVILGDVAHDAVPVADPDVDKHVRVGVLGVPHRGVVVARVGTERVVLPTKLFVQGLLLALNGHPVVIKLEPGLAIWPDESVVVATMDATAVYQHAVQAILVAHALVCVLGEGFPLLEVQVNLLVELIPVIDLDVGVPLEVVLKALELQLQHWRHILEQDALACILQAVPLRLVLVGSIHDLHLTVLLKRLVDVLAALDVQLQVHERLIAGGLVVHVDALNVVGGVALKQLVDNLLHAGALHLLLQLLTQHPVELLHVVLHERIVRAPPK